MLVPLPPTCTNALAHTARDIGVRLVEIAPPVEQFSRLGARVGSAFPEPILPLLFRAPTQSCRECDRCGGCDQPPTMYRAQDDGEGRSATLIADGRRSKLRHLGAGFVAPSRGIRELQGITMELGLFTMPGHPPERDLREGWEWDLQVIEWADEFGFGEAWIGEHHAAKWEPHPAPDLLTIEALRRTKNIRIGPGGFLLPYYHPAELANRISLLDHLSEGRLNFGVAASGLPSDWEMASTAWPARTAR